MTLPEAADALEALAAHATPLLVGVRHHSPACAAAIPAILDAFAPEHVWIELPAELDGWLGWLAHEETVAPVALAAALGDALAFYPFADFSPELAAARWARARGVPVGAFDLPLADRQEHLQAPDHLARGAPLLDALLRTTGAADAESLWEELVETRAIGADAEAVRRAALAYGWAMRADAGLAGTADEDDLRREAYMRERLAGGPARAAAIVGSFHAAGLASEPVDPLPRRRGSKRRKKAPSFTTSLVPYRFDLLDSRSGYPAGIRDPAWQQRVWEALSAGASVDDAVADVLVGVGRAVREAGHAAGTPDAREAVRVARDLARLRDLPAPGRRELVEGVRTAIGQGEAWGRERVVARALEDALVGERRGRLAPGTPASGLGPHVRELLEALRLPGPGTRRRTALRLDPLRSDLDRRRHVTLHRASAAGIDYAEPEDAEAPGELEPLTQPWSVRWSPSTDASIEVAGTLGVTLRQAAAGAVTARVARLRTEGRFSASIRLAVLEVAAECGLPEIVDPLLAELDGPFLLDASLADIAGAIALVERIAHGHVPGLPREPTRGPGRVDAYAPPPVPRDALLLAGLRALDGLAGSDADADADALARFARIAGEAEGRLGVALDRLAAQGSPLIQGAAEATRVLVGRGDAAALGRRAGSWLDAAVDASGRRALARRIAGTATAAGAALEAWPEALVGLDDRLAALDDAGFHERLPALRDGFDVLSPAARERLLDAVIAAIGATPSVPAAPLPDSLRARLREADAAGADAVRRAGLGDAAGKTPAATALAAPSPPVAAGVPPAAAETRRIERWRLVLGRDHDSPEARALDALYGAGRGEGSRAEGLATDAPIAPDARDWAGTLGELFGREVREEVLGRAAERGDVEALLALDPDTVRPSVDLLRQALAHKDALPEDRLAALRPLVARLVDALVREVAQQVRPALTGAWQARPTRRPTGRLDLRRTVAANLRGVRFDDRGFPVLLPERLVFRSRARRALDWRLLLLVDCSGSMDASVVHAAVSAAILAGLPALDVRFLAFSTQVIDLSEHVDDPLGLLLGVRVGGGTDLGRALATARSMIEVPARTLLVVISDFDEGQSVPRLLAEVRALVDAGVAVLGLAALDDDARPRFHEAVASAVVEAGMPVAALTPLELARWVAERLR